MLVISCARSVFAIKKPVLLAIVAALFLTLPAQAIWFEASGQAVIEGHNQDVARQRATQEAIKQALLFAGASVNSVQKMANGLLKDDRFEIRASGEVRSIELVDEIYHDNYVTVTIRADIFPQQSSCEAADYKKLITAAWFPVKHRQQATVGAVQDIGKSISQRLALELDEYSRHAKINKLEPYFLYVQESADALLELGRKNNSQFILVGEIADISLQSNASSRLLFWKDHSDTRQLGINIALYDVMTGEQVLQESFSTQASWPFDHFMQVDVASKAFWDSTYGKNANQLIQNISQRFDEVLDCKPAYGRVLQVANNQLKVNLGEVNGAKVGDTLTLFQLQRFLDQFGQAYQQYQIHPVTVEVSRIFPHSAIVSPVDGLPLGNIQTNDFVARR